VSKRAVTFSKGRNAFWIASTAACSIFSLFVIVITLLGKLTGEDCSVAVSKSIVQCSEVFTRTVYLRGLAGSSRWVDAPAALGLDDEEDSFASIDVLTDIRPVCIIEANQSVDGELTRQLSEHLDVICHI